MMQQHLWVLAFCFRIDLSSELHIQKGGQMDMYKLNIFMLSTSSSVSVLAVQLQIPSFSSQEMGNNLFL